MFYVIHRAPRPDVIVWPGRRLLAVVDASLYPALFVVLILNLPSTTGAVRMVSVGLAVVAAVGRIGRAVLRNERYRFATWRWGRMGVSLLITGLAIKAATTWTCRL